MPEFITPAHPGSSILHDLDSLEDQLRRCSRGEPSRWHLAALADLPKRFLRRHLVSIVVLLALLGAALSLGA